MKLCLVYSLQDNKLHPKAYTSIFKDEFEALKNSFEEVQLVTDNCSAEDIDADLIFFFDPHASHHVKIDGLEKHRAVKMELWNDVHQEEVQGYFESTQLPVHKLGQAQRAIRTKERGIDFIITATKYLFFELFEKRFGPDIEKMTLYHPHAPKMPEKVPLLKDRKAAVVGNGAYKPESYRGSYDFRGWGFKQSYIEYVPHALANGDNKAPMGTEYINWLSTYAGAFTGALCPVPKYSEIQAAGCVAFLQYQKEWEEAGFKDHEGCIYVRKANLQAEVEAFLIRPDCYQDMADRGREVMQRYSAERFADFVHRKAEESLTEKEDDPVYAVRSKPTFSNIFILNSGRCGSTTFIKACEHITNYTAGHETRSGFVGPERLNYPKGHIEADNRLSWFLGRLDREYGDDAFYVHLYRDKEAVAQSFAKRMKSGGIITAYRNSILMGGTRPDDLSVCRDYMDTVETNIEAFLEGQLHTMDFRLENAKSDFKHFWDTIGAEGDLDAALEEFDVKHNQSVG